MMTREAIAEVLSVHRWKSMGVASVECECGAILYGDDKLTQFPADEAFRDHIADAVLALKAKSVNGIEVVGLGKLSRSVLDVQVERNTHAGRGWTAEHDAAHGGVQHLVEVAGEYAYRVLRAGDDLVEARRQLVKAASLLVAAIDLLDQEADDDDA